MEKENTFDESMMTAVDELSDEERKLQEDIDWLQVFKDQLVKIERG